MDYAWIGSGGGLAPQIVDHDVGISSGLAEPLGDGTGLPRQGAHWS
jgi:hypothetical protein